MLARISITESLAVVAINTAIETDDPSLLMKTLQHPKSQLPEVCDFAGPLYMEEFKNMREEKEVTMALAWVKVFRIIPEFRILRLKSASKC